MSTDQEWIEAGVLFGQGSRLAVATNRDFKKLHSPKIFNKVTNAARTHLMRINFIRSFDQTGRPTREIREI